MRPIDADAMRKEWLENGENEYVYDTNAVLDSIDQQPTIEPPRWIPVTERLPDARKGESECLVYSDVIGVKSGLYIPQWGGFYDGTGKDGDLFVTHWMPIPSTEGLDG